MIRLWRHILIQHERLLSSFFYLQNNSCFILRNQFVSQGISGVIMKPTLHEIDLSGIQGKNRNESG